MWCQLGTLTLRLTYLFFSIYIFEHERHLAKQIKNAWWVGVFFLLLVILYYIYFFLVRFIYSLNKLILVKILNSTLVLSLSGGHTRHQTLDNINIFFFVLINNSSLIILEIILYSLYILNIFYLSLSLPFT